MSRVLLVMFTFVSVLHNILINFVFTTLYHFSICLKHSMSEVSKVLLLGLIHTS